MRNIFKYPIRLTKNLGITSVSLPANSEILSVGNQYGALYLWALVNPNETLNETIYLEAIETGKNIKDGFNGTFLNTVHFYNNSYILHIFEIKKRGG